MKTYFHLLAFLFIFASCAKVSYMAEQGVGQISLEWNGRENKKVIEKKDQALEEKERMIEELQKKLKSLGENSF